MSLPDINFKKDPSYFRITIKIVILNELVLILLSVGSDHHNPSE